MKRYSDKPTTVSRLLGKRHERSTSTGSMVRGYPLTSPGFVVARSGNHTIVTHTFPNIRRKDDRPVEAHLETYAATLRKHGYTVTLETPEFGDPHLEVEGLKTYRVSMIGSDRRWGWVYTVEDPEDAVRKLVRKEFGRKAFFHVESTRKDLDYAKLQYGQVFKDLPKGGSTALTDRVRVEVSYD
jgi:hypothetical protein